MTTSENRDQVALWPRRPCPLEGGVYDIEWIKEWRNFTGLTLKEGIEAHCQALRTPAHAPGKAGDREGLTEAWASIQWTKGVTPEVNEFGQATVCLAPQEFERMRLAALAPSPTGNEAPRGAREGLSEEHRADLVSLRNHLESEGHIHDADAISAALAVLAATPTPSLSPEVGTETLARQEALNEAAKIAEDWLRIYGGRPIKHISPTEYATDAATDIADGIRALAAAPPPPVSTEPDSRAGAEREALEPGEAWWRKRSANWGAWEHKSEATKQHYAKLEAAALNPSPPTASEAAAPVGEALADIAVERRRQVEAEGWTPEHDDQHAKGEMASAAACYALPQGQRWNLDARDYRKIIEHIWPWHARWWKPGDRRRELVKAGALIVAEIERFDRLSSEVQIQKGRL